MIGKIAIRSLEPKKSMPDLMSKIQHIGLAEQTVLCTTDDEFSRALPDAEVVAGLLPKALLDLSDKLKWVQSWAAGPDQQLFQEFIDHPATLTCAKGNGAIPLAEHAIMLMLMLNRNALRWIDNQRAKTWEHYKHAELAGKTVGIIGTGHSGIELAFKAKAFRMKVVGLRRSQEKPENFDGIYSGKEIKEFLGACDFVVMTAPLTPETRNMLGEAEFKAMRSDAFYICFSRGGVADDTALLRALNEGWIGGAGLDAHSIEPLPADSPFWTAPNTIVTPHNGATSPETNIRGQEIFVENLLRYRDGRPLINIVDKALGY